MNVELLQIMQQWNRAGINDAADVAGKIYNVLIQDEIDGNKALKLILELQYALNNAVTISESEKVHT